MPTEQIIELIQHDLPDGQISKIPSSPLCKNILIFRIANQRYSFSVPPMEGRCATSSTRGGMRWTRGGALTRHCSRGRRSRVVLTPRRWCQVLRDCPRGDGGNKARSP